MGWDENLAITQRQSLVRQCNDVFFFQFKENQTNASSERSEFELIFACGEAVSRVLVKFCLDNVRLHSLNCSLLVQKCPSSE